MSKMSNKRNKTGPNTTGYFQFSGGNNNFRSRFPFSVYASFTNRFKHLSCYNNGSSHPGRPRSVKFRRVQPPELLLSPDLHFHSVFASFHCHSFSHLHQESLHATPRFCNSIHPFSFSCLICLFCCFNRVEINLGMC